MAIELEAWAEHLKRQLRGEEVSPPGAEPGPRKRQDSTGAQEEPEDPKDRRSIGRETSLIPYQMRAHLGFFSGVVVGASIGLAIGLVVGKSMCFARASSKR